MSQKKNTEKKPKYSAPKLLRYGSVRELTQAVTATMGMDGGVGVSNMVMNCVTAAPYIEEHRHLLTDGTQEQFRKAIFASVKPGDVVLDLGAGSGLHSFFACQAGARKVYAIEFEPVIDLARAAAAKNGFSQKIEFLEGLSTDLELPEKVDVIITNTGYLNVLRYLPDARRRFLKPGGRLVPGSVTNAFVPVCANSAYADCVESWSGKVFGFDFSDFRLHAVHTPYYNQFSEGEFVAEPQDAPAIDYSRDLPKIFHWKLEFTAKRTDLIHGILGWYTFHLGGGAAFSTKPPLAYSPYIWSQYFFPLERPLPVREGEKISVSIDMCPEGREQEPVWKWELRVGGQPVQSSSNFHTAALRIEH